MLTWIFAVVLGSRKDFTVFHNILNPEPALMMNMRFKVCSKATNSMILLSNPGYVFTTKTFFPGYNAVGKKNTSG